MAVMPCHEPAAYTQLLVSRMKRLTDLMPLPTHQRSRRSCRTITANHYNNYVWVLSHPFTNQTNRYRNVLQFEMHITSLLTTLASMLIY